MMRLLGVCFLFLICLGCNKSNSKGIYNQGKLEYAITYLNAEKDNFDPSFLPKKMILEFNQDYSINMINGFMGFFKLGNITYFKNEKVKTHLKVLDKNYTYSGRKNEMMCCFDEMQNMNIADDTTTLTIGGLKSKKVDMKLPGTDELYEIYYTDEINLKNPNSTNPYHHINGVLTQFVLKMGPYIMQFRATKFDSSYEPQKEMEIPVDALNVGREEMFIILDRLLQQNI